MDVSGRELRRYCKPCDQRKTSTYSVGFCSQCEEEMCQSCFDTHKQWKLNRDHKLLSPDKATPQIEEEPKLDTCSRHLNHDIELFCLDHCQVGCDDCMVISHKNCKVVNILEHIHGYQSDEEFKSLKKDLSEYDREANAMLEKVKRDKDFVRDIHKKFARDVNSFRDEMISYITKLADEMLTEENDTFRADMKNIDQLEKGNMSLVKETTKMKESLQSEADQPYRMFISCVSYKHNLHLILEQLERIREKNTTETYEFKRDSYLAQSIKNCKQIGTIQKKATSEEATPALREETNQEMTEASVKKTQTSFRQPLLERHSVCKNINIDGHIIRYHEQELGDIGIFVDKNQLEHGSTFEIEILTVSNSRSIAIGVVPDNYADNLLPGIRKQSVGYHNDGSVYRGNTSGTKRGDPWQVGDIISVIISRDGWQRKSIWIFDWFVEFKHNGKLIDGGSLPWFKAYHFAVGLRCSRDVIKVIKLPAK